MTAQQIEATRADPVVPKEVVGWLLMFCLILTIVLPVRIFYEIFWHAIPKLIGAHAPLRALLLSAYSILFSVIAVFSFVAGRRLWLVKPNAVRFARRYLLTYLSAHVAYFVFWMLVDRPTSSVALAQMGWQHVVGPLPFVALWYSYLEHSKRVRATYLSG
jgi:hypothetical protein